MAFGGPSAGTMLGSSWGQQSVPRPWPKRSRAPPRSWAVLDGEGAWIRGAMSPVGSPPRPDHGDVPRILGVEGCLRSSTSARPGLPTGNMRAWVDVPPCGFSVTIDVDDVPSFQRLCSPGDAVADHNELIECRVDFL